MAALFAWFEGKLGAKIELEGADTSEYREDVGERFDAFGDEGAKFAGGEHAKIVADLPDDGVNGFVGDGFLFVASGMKEHGRSFVLENRKGEACEVTFSDAAVSFEKDGGGLGGEGLMEEAT